MLRESRQRALKAWPSASVWCALRARLVHAPLPKLDPTKNMPIPEGVLSLSQKSGITELLRAPIKPDTEHKATDPRSSDRASNPLSFNAVLTRGGGFDAETLLKP